MNPEFEYGSDKDWTLDIAVKATPVSDLLSDVPYSSDEIRKSVGVKLLMLRSRLGTAKLSKDYEAVNHLLEQVSHHGKSLTVKAVTYLNNVNVPYDLTYLNDAIITMAQEFKNATNSLSGALTPIEQATALAEKFNLK